MIQICYSINCMWQRRKKSKVKKKFLKKLKKTFDNILKIWYINPAFVKCDMIFEN